MDIKFTVYGSPMAQGRPRATRSGIVYDPAKSRMYKQGVAAEARRVYTGPLLDCPLLMNIKIYKAPPGSWSKKKRTNALLGLIKPTTKPDLSNILKGIEDALEGVIYRNDSAIVASAQAKFYGEPERVEVEIIWCG